MIPRVRVGKRKLYARHIVQCYDGHGGLFYYYLPRRGWGSVQLQENPTRPSVTELDAHGKHVHTFFYDSNEVAHRVAYDLVTEMDRRAA